MIRGAAVNNDGGGKASFTAPSVEGQAAVIAMALAMRPASMRAAISYVEAHGTATPLGDPIEIEGADAARSGAHTADARLLRASARSRATSATWSSPAGAAGLIKTALALRGEETPAEPALRGAESRDRLREQPVRRRQLSCAPGRAASDAAARGRQLVRRRRHQRARRWSRRRPHATRSPMPPQRPQLLLLSARTPSRARKRRSSASPRISPRTATSTLADVAYTLRAAARRSRTAHAVVAEDSRGGARLCASATTARCAHAHRRCGACLRSSSCSPARARSTPAWAARCTRRARVPRRASTNARELLAGAARTSICASVLFSDDDAAALAPTRRSTQPATVRARVRARAPAG